MDRAYLSGAAGSAPTEPSDPSIGYPTAGNPSTGTTATKPGAYWYHMIMEELMAVIVAAGIAPAKGVLTQLLQALRSAGVFMTQSFSDRSTKVATTEWVYGAMATVMSYFGFVISLAASGYIKFPSVLGGLIIQWGAVSIVGLAGGGFTYPITFPNAFLSLIGSVDHSSDTATFATAYSTGAPKTTGAFRLNNSNTRTVNWIAIGY